MKPLPLLLPLLSLSVVVAVTGAFLWASHAAPSPDSAPNPAAVRAADERGSEHEAAFPWTGFPAPEPGTQLASSPMGATHQRSLRDAGDEAE